MNRSPFQGWNKGRWAACSGQGSPEEEVDSALRDGASLAWVTFCVPEAERQAATVGPGPFLPLSLRPQPWEKEEGSEEQ